MTQQISEQDAQKAMDGVRRGIFDGAFPALLEKLQSRKGKGTEKEFDVGVIAEALTTFAHYVAANGKFVVGPETDLIISLGIEAISAAAVAARERVEEKRIIVLR